MPQLRSPAIRLALGPLLIFVAVWTFRWLSMGALENDHFVALARAHQMLFGQWPVHDFADPGQPLTYMVSAGAAWLFSPTLRTDVILAITLLSLAAALTYSLAARASGSLLIAAAAVAVEVAAAPRLYNAGKVLIPLAAVGLGWRYADAPSRPRLLALAAWTAIACLWRHDFIVYVAVPTLVLLAVIHERPRALRLGLLYLAVTLGVVLPWLMYVQWAGGLVDYLAAAFRFAATEAQRTVAWPGEAWVTFVVIMAIPLIAIVVARNSDRPVAFTHVAFAASMALVVNMVLLRDVIATRLPRRTYHPGAGPAPDRQRRAARCRRDRRLDAGVTRVRRADTRSTRSPLRRRVGDAAKRDAGGYTQSRTATVDSLSHVVHASRRTCARQRIRPRDPGTRPSSICGRTAVVDSWIQHPSARRRARCHDARPRRRVHRCTARGLGRVYRRVAEAGC
jgi:hypothetical protein